MNRLWLSGALLLAVAAPALAQQTTPGELARDQRRIEMDQAQLDRARAGNPVRVDDRRADLRDSRQEYRADARGVTDPHYADRDGAQGWQQARDDNRRHDRDDRYGDHRNDRRWDGNRYRAGGYDYPRGYGYQRWAPGAYVPTAYWRGDRYWITNPADYRLSRPWQDVRWLRVGPDALLIRLRSGQVIQVVRGLFRY